MRRAGKTAPTGLTTEDKTQILAIYQSAGAEGDEPADDEILANLAVHGGDDDISF